jgi:uncharacterized protein with HEPN domain
MRSDPLGALEDMKRHILLAQEFAANVEFEAFSEDIRTLLAVIRCLEVISEASRRLSDEVKIRHASIPWKEIAGAGNIYRHDYENVATRRVWNTVQLALPPLLEAVTQELNRLSA